MISSMDLTQRHRLVGALLVVCGILGILRDANVVPFWTLALGVALLLAAALLYLMGRKNAAR
jgi:hypothetical protein